MQNLFDKTHLRIPLFRYALEWMWRWSCIATLVPTRWIFISRSFLSKDLKHSQVDAEIEVAGENEKEQDSAEAEIELPRKSPKSRVYFSSKDGALYPLLTAVKLH